ncbi:MAG: hypothetical protein ACFCGT_00085 [Sandaracinaceae bacterium]
MQHEPNPIPTRLRHAAAVTIALLLAIGAAPVAHGDEQGPPEALNGRWRNTAADGGEQAIARAVERGIDGLFALARPVARRRLTESNPPIRQLEIEVTSSRIHVDLGAGREHVTPPNTWRPEDSPGGRIQVRQTITGSGTLKVESRADQGSARHLFRLEGDDRLRHQVRIHAERLPHDVVYNLTYRRAG